MPLPENARVTDLNDLTDSSSYFKGALDQVVQHGDLSNLQFTIGTGGDGKNPNYKFRSADGNETIYRMGNSHNNLRQADERRSQRWSTRSCSLIELAVAASR